MEDRSKFLTGFVQAPKAALNSTSARKNTLCNGKNCFQRPTLKQIPDHFVAKRVRPKIMKIQKWKCRKMRAPMSKC